MFKVFVAAIAVCLSQGVCAKPAMPKNTIECSKFKKDKEGCTPIGFVTFDLGSTKGTTLVHLTIRPNSVKIGNYDLYTVLERKCRH